MPSENRKLRVGDAFGPSDRTHSTDYATVLAISEYGITWLYIGEGTTELYDCARYDLEELTTNLFSYWTYLGNINDE